LSSEFGGPGSTGDSSLKSGDYTFIRELGIVSIDNESPDGVKVNHVVEAGWEQRAHSGVFARPGNDGGKFHITEEITGHEWPALRVSKFEALLLREN
jgi:hypothetical protein